MKPSVSTIWEKIIEDARFYPSPHNSQPIKIKFIDELTADIFYDLDLGLTAENYGIPFAHVCAGVFLHSVSVVAQGNGYTVREILYPEDMDFSSKTRLHPLGRLTLELIQSTQQMIDMLETFKSRQTSRRPYDNSLVDPSVVENCIAIATSHGQMFNVTANKKLVKNIVFINQATLFDDLLNEPVYKEIMHWLRFSKEEAIQKADGLSAETMIVPGGLLHFAMSHRDMWKLPVIGGIIRALYLRTTNGVRQLGWLEGPFNGPKDYIEAGRTFMTIWLYLTTQGVYLHPFGTVITNPSSHKSFAELLKLNEDSSSMAWMLFRFGHSKVPPLSYRRTKESMIIS